MKKTKEFLNRHKSVKRWVYKYKGFSGKTSFFLFPIIIILLIGLGAYISKPTDLSSLNKKDGFITNVDSVDGVWADTITFSLEDESYCCRVPALISEDVFEKMKTIESQASKIVISTSDHPIQLLVNFPYSTAAKNVVDIHSDEVIYSISHHNDLIFGYGILFYVIAGFLFLIWLFQIICFFVC